jgi:phosphohistidine phosphatase
MLGELSLQEMATEMKRLWLLRHAKASVGGDGLADRDRPLNEKGRDGAARIGRHLARSRARPELVLCSPSLRTRETLELVEKELGKSLSTEFDDELYLASERSLQARIQSVADDVDSVMLVGHNPGVAELALRLAVRGDRDALADLRRKVPTGALAEFSVHSERWRQFARRCELVGFVTPKQLS